MNLVSWDQYHRFVYLMALLVVGLRVWGDYDRPHWTNFPPSAATIQLLYDHVPADDIRFVFNFPASLLSSFVAPPPVLRPPMSTAGFAFREGVSILLEVFLTLAFWFGIQQLIKRRPFLHLTRVPLRVALPVFFTFWTAYFTYLGGLQIAEISPRGGRFSYVVARHLFSAFAINAPAWFASSFFYNLFITGSFYINTLDTIYNDLFEHYRLNFHRIGDLPWEYLGLVILMWFLIGSRFDQLRQGKNTEEKYKLSQLNRIIWSLCALYGLWLLYEAIGSFSYGDYELWFSIVAMVWSAVTICGSFYILARDAKGRWGLSTRIICLIIGLAAIGGANLLSAKPDLVLHYLDGWIPRYTTFARYEFWRNLTIAAWGLALFLEGSYFLWRWKDRPATAP